jgi:hypothetical protein
MPAHPVERPVPCSIVLAPKKQSAHPLGCALRQVDLLSAGLQSHAATAVFQLPSAKAAKAKWPFHQEKATRQNAGNTAQIGKLL